MRVVVCAKEVLDPDAVGNYALAGRLVIGEDGRTLTQTTIPRLMNAYDEQAIEAALRLRDAGADFTLVVVSLGPDPASLLRHAAAMGADEIAGIVTDTSSLDGHAVASALAAFIRLSGGADLILCGRQASDDDQGVVPALLGEMLGMPVVTVARGVELGSSPDGLTIRVSRVTPDGGEVVETRCPSVVTISNELGAPRYPTTAMKIAARRKQASRYSLDDLPVSAEQLRPKVTLSRQLVPDVRGSCEFISGATPAEIADALARRLRDDGLLA